MNRASRIQRESTIRDTVKSSGLEEKKAREQALRSIPRTSELKYQVLITLSFFLGLFFIEYPPLFLAGYWSWGYWVHKILSGAFIVLNLLLTQFLVRRWGFFRHPPGSTSTAEV
jgi:hypothetical protein